MSTEVTLPSTTTSTATITTVPIRRSYRCYHCNYSFHISTTAAATGSTATAPSSFRCPSCHHRHLLPHHIVSPTSTTTSTTTITTVPTRRSYRCYHCNHSFHITNITAAAGSTDTTPSSFRCPSCHHRHLLPHYIVSPTPPPHHIVSPTPPPNSYRIIHIPSDSDFSSHPDDDDSFVELTAGDHPKLTPSSKAFVDSLPTIELDPASASQSCPICMDDLGIDSAVNRLPCQHVFHKDCIVQWLNRANTCPLCRCKLPQEPSLSPTVEVEEEEDRWVQNLYHELVNQRLGVINRLTARINSEPVPVAASGLGRWAAREFGAEEQSSDALHRDADGDTLMVDA